MYPFRAVKTEDERIRRDAELVVKIPRTREAEKNNQKPWCWDRRRPGLPVRNRTNCNSQIMPITDFVSLEVGSQSYLLM